MQGVSYTHICTVIFFPTNPPRYKRESYRGSEYAPRILADNGLPVVMKSDHPVLNSRYLLYEAQQAHYFGLPSNLALASVTSTPAIAAGLSHRIGILREGSDADVVLWDTHPLQLGATPMNVWIDGIMEVPMSIEKGGEGAGVVVGKGKGAAAWQRVPEVPNWDRETQEAIEWEGLPPLLGKKHQGLIMFENVAELWVKEADGLVEHKFGTDDLGLGGKGVVVVDAGQVICSGSYDSCSSSITISSRRIDLRGGSISPGLLSFGSPLGTEEIEAESSTGPGESFDPLSKDTPKVIGDVAAIVKASDALQFQTRNAL
jgi:Amidohydrolase family